MNIQTLDTIDELRSALGLEAKGEILEPDIDIVETEFDWYERKRRDAEVLCALAANTTGNCLDFGASRGRSAYRIASNLKERGIVYTVPVFTVQSTRVGGSTHNPRLSRRENLGGCASRHGFKNLRQLEAVDSAALLPEAEFQELKVVYFNAPCDAQVVYRNSIIICEFIKLKGYIAWQGFNPQLRRKFVAIDYVMSGVEKFLFDTYKDKKIYHLKNSWIGILEVNKSNFLVHPLEWDKSYVMRFWDYISSSTAGKEQYFSLQVGEGVSRFIALVCGEALKGRVLDYGCGPGFLLEHLAGYGGQLFGLDASLVSIEEVEQRMAGRAKWKGAKHLANDHLPYDDGYFDLITCVETLEHVLPSELDSLLAEFRRVLKAGNGLLVLTTPFEECLDRAEVLCPECGAVFHRWQHLRSFGRLSLSSLMEQRGFRTKMCVNLDFYQFQGSNYPGDGNINLPNWFASRLGHGPHLVWIGNRV